MVTTRRDLLRHFVIGGAAGAAHLGLSRVASAQPEERRLAEQVAADLSRHASFGDKFAGGRGDLATAAWIAGRLRTSGYQIAESTFDAPFFVARTTRLVTGATAVEVMAQAPVVPTGAAGVTAPLALVDGAVGNVRDRVAVIVLPAARHAALFADRGIGQTVTTVANAGARAIVIVTTGPTGEAIALNSPETPFVPVPAAVLAPKRAAPIVAAARTGATATLVLDGEATHRPSPNVTGTLRRGDRWLAISTPRSGWFGCVGERGTGTAVFLELADWVVRRFPAHSIFVMNTGGHEYFFAGSHRALAQAPPPEKTVLWTHVGATVAARDARDENGREVMLDTADPQRSLMASDSARTAAAVAFAGLSGLETPTPVRAGAGELSTFTDKGYKTAFAVIGVHRWFHTRLDTIERVDAKLVVPVLRAHQRAIEMIVEA